MFRQVGDFEEDRSESDEELLEKANKRSMNSNWGSGWFMKLRELILSTLTLTVLSILALLIGAATMIAVFLSVKYLAQWLWTLLA